MKLYLFNPDADMSLGNNEENYMAPATIRQMAEDLAVLPVWYAQSGSSVLAPSAYNADFLHRMQRLFPLEVRLMTEPELSDHAEVQVLPWGWSPALRRRMLRGGVSEKALPASDALRMYRCLSARSNVLALRARFQSEGMEEVCGTDGCLVQEGDTSASALPEIIRRYEEGCVCKSLWSSSGKGLCWCRCGFTKHVSDWCNRALKTDGAFLIEPILDKVGDFAMEFYSDGRGKVRFAGYSHFVTDDKGAYRGNLLVSDEQVEAWLCRYVSVETVVRLRSKMRQELETLYGNSYEGFLGVDMMVCRRKGGKAYAINPHVEINLRMNMGVVSHIFCERFMAPGRKGLFSIDYFPTNEALQERHARDVQEHPLCVEQGRVVSGYLPLVPVTPRSRYRAFVKVAVCDDISDFCL